MIHASDILIPLATKIRRHMNLTPTAVFSRFSQNGLVSLERMIDMIREFLGVKVSPEEREALNKYLQEAGRRRDAALDKAGLESVISGNYKRGFADHANQREVERCQHKIEKTIRLKGINFMSTLKDY